MSQSKHSLLALALLGTIAAAGAQAQQASEQQKYDLKQGARLGLRLGRPGERNCPVIRRRSSTMRRRPPRRE